MAFSCFSRRSSQVLLRAALVSIAVFGTLDVLARPGLSADTHSEAIATRSDLNILAETTQNLLTEIDEVEIRRTARLRSHYDAVLLLHTRLNEFEQEINALVADAESHQASAPSPNPSFHAVHLLHRPLTTKSTEAHPAETKSDEPIYAETVGVLQYLGIDLAPEGSFDPDKPVSVEALNAHTAQIEPALVQRLYGVWFADEINPELMVERDEDVMGFAQMQSNAVNKVTELCNQISAVRAAQMTSSMAKQTNTESVAPKTSSDAEIMTPLSPEPVNDLQSILDEEVANILGDSSASAADDAVLTQGEFALYLRTAYGVLASAREQGSIEQNRIFSLVQDYTVIVSRAELLMTELNQAFPALTSE